MRASVFFLGVAGGGILVAAVGGCGSVVNVEQGGSGTGARHHSSVDGGPNGGAGGGDGSVVYIDPGCPDAGMNPTMFECDPYSQNNGDCASNEGCYIFSTPPQDPCGQETYGAQCAPEGPGQQGDPCSNGNSCAAGFTCTVTGSGDQCIQLCQLAGGTICPSGYVCQPIDVQGFGGCL